MGEPRRSLASGMVVLLVLTTASATVRADDDRPPTSHLIWAGLGMALPTYAIGVVAHEGSHALAARWSGATIKTLRVLPGFHPRTGKFYFGYVEVRGLRCDRQRAGFLLAPKLTDAVALGAYAAAFYAGAYPEGRYGQLALTVLATGFWIDFSRDVFAFWDHNDMVKTYRLAGAETELARVPYRLLHAGLAAAGAIAIVQGYRRIFAGAPESGEGDPAGGAAFVPLWLGSF